jgi:methyl-accepting chemotaxis protein
MQRRDEIGGLARAYNSSVSSLDEYIHQIDKTMNALSQGNFAIASIENFHGEFMKIQESINAFLDSINKTFAQIDQAAEQVLNGSDQGANTSQALSQGATEQASAVEELDATVHDISNHIQQNAENAEAASREASDLGENIISNNQQMQDMIVAMGEISNCSDEISRIIKTIQDIAFQTNILALNAAVEAARAGSAGKGFAVVADEVRNLASKTAEAAQDTTVLIENSIRAVNNGMKIADDTAQSLASIVSKAQEVVNVINQISEASHEQAESVSQVTQGISQISNVVQTNTATAEETAASSEELSGQAQLLKRMMSKYRLRNGSVDNSMGAYQNSNVPDDSAYDEIFGDMDFSSSGKY